MQNGPHPPSDADASLDVRRYFIVCHHRGGSRHRQFSRSLQALGETGVEATVRYCTSSAHARELAREFDHNRYDAIIAAGGDGIVNDVVAGLLQRDGPELPPMGVLPIGTGNQFAQEAGFRGKRLSELPHQLHALKPHNVHIGKVASGEIFTLIAVVGFGPQMMEKVSDHLKRRLGIAAYVIAGVLALLTYKSRRYKVTVAGEDYHAYTVLVVNACLSSGPIPLIPGTSLLDPSLRLGLVERPGRLFLAKLLWKFVCGRLHECPGFRIIECTSCEVTGDGDGTKSDPLMTDGDVTGRLPAVFSVHPQSISVLGFPDKSNATSSRSQSLSR
eukprot:s1_g2612.t1